MSKIINGDITNISKGVIIHQANNKRVMGAGVAKAMVIKYPKHKQDYLKADMTLGNVVYSKVDKTIAIIAMITQDGFGRDKTKVYTIYKAFEEALLKINGMHEKYPNLNYYMPYGIGCGLANGDWNIISKMIENICPFIILIKKN